MKSSQAPNFMPAVPVCSFCSPGRTSFKSLRNHYVHLTVRFRFAFGDENFFRVLKTAIEKVMPRNTAATFWPRAITLDLSRRRTLFPNPTESTFSCNNPHLSVKCCWGILCASHKDNTLLIRGWNNGDHRIQFRLKVWAVSCSADAIGKYISLPISVKSTVMKKKK